MFRVKKVDLTLREAVVVGYPCMQVRLDLRRPMKGERECGVAALMMGTVTGFAPLSRA